MGVNLTDVEVVAASELASWGRRLAALMIDSVVLATIITVTVLAAGVSPEELNDRIRNGESRSSSSCSSSCRRRSTPPR